eukprot:TRINITY_DN21019_c2_g1_i1.p1 TRINITY_DN21019_c2_g1~~TRINITY_DN21019_c2_g1_i1.p1  ORF type:complete len:2152 (+),score=426.31 TRINITY_DN21019_c2_g1_i1:129-6584(+)
MRRARHTADGVYVRRSPLLLRLVSLCLFASLAHGKDEAPKVDNPGELVQHLQDLLAGGVAKEPAKAGVEAVVRFTRRAASHGKTKELLKVLGGVLKRELSQAAFEEGAQTGREELKALHEQFKVCQHAGKRRKAFAKMDELQESHAACRKREAAALLAYKADCNMALLSSLKEDTSDDQGRCRHLGEEYMLKRTACNALQDNFDSYACSRGRRPESCDQRLACEMKVLEAMHTARDTIEAQEREFLGLSFAAATRDCLAHALGAGGATLDEAVLRCEAAPQPQAMPRQLYGPLGALPELTPCQSAGVALLETESSSSSSLGLADYGELPKEAPAKTCSSDCCASLLQQEADPQVTDSYDASDYELEFDMPPPIALNGCKAWFRSEDAAVPWPSLVSSHEGKVISDGADAKTHKGHGAGKQVKFVQGGPNVRFDFGDVLESTYSLCSASRYTGDKKRRILQASQDDWLHGHSAGKAGVVCSGQTSSLTPEDWVVVCDTSKSSSILVNGDEVSRADCPRAQLQANQHLVINHGAKWDKTSNWAVMEVIVWNRVLSQTELSRASSYLKNKVAEGTPLNLKISHPDMTCNDKRIQVQMGLIRPEGWRHYADGEDTTDKRLYAIPESRVGTIKIREDPRQIVSQRDPSELIPWGHSSLQGRMFLIKGNSEGPKMLSFFAGRKDIRLRIYIDGTEWKDVDVPYGITKYVEHDFSRKSIKVWGTHDFLMVMSSDDGKYSLAVAPAAKTIFGSCLGEWYVVNSRGAATEIVQTCSDGTSHTYSTEVLSHQMHAAKKASLFQKAAETPGWYITDSTSTSCDAKCTSVGLKCRSDTSLLSSKKKIQQAVKGRGITCSQTEGPTEDRKLAATVVQVSADNLTCNYPDLKAVLNCTAEQPDSATSFVCLCDGGEEEPMFKFAAMDSNVCPHEYRAIESKADCKSYTNGEMQGLPAPSVWTENDPNSAGSPSGCFKDLDTGEVGYNSIAHAGYKKLDAWQKADHRKICRKAVGIPDDEPLCKFTATEDETFLGGVSYEQETKSAVSFLEPGVFQMETMMPFDVSSIKLVSNKNATCKVHGKNYKLYGVMTGDDGSGVHSIKLDKRLKAHSTISCNNNVMAIGRKNLSPDASPSTVPEPRLNLLGAEACSASAKRGVGGLRHDTKLELEFGFVLTKILEMTASSEIFTIRDEEFNNLLDPSQKYPVMKRHCPSCAATHTEIWYRRFTSLKEYDAYHSFACSFKAEPHNVMNTDFKLFSDLASAFADEQEWQHRAMSPASLLRGFPGECGPHGALGDQWDSIPVDAGGFTGRCTKDTGGRPVTYYGFLPVEKQVFRDALSLDSNGRIMTVEPEEFNRRFQQSRYHIIQRICRTCVKTHRHIFYRRLTNVDTFEPYKYFACDWKGDRNAWSVDYKMYSNLLDALNDHNAWPHCGYDGNGFPGTCSPTGEGKRGQTSYIPVPGCSDDKSGKAVTFSIYEDEVSEEVPEDDEDTKHDADAQLPPAVVPSDGLVAWFRSEDASTSWKSVVGDFRATAGSGLVRSASRHYGASMNHIYGDSRSSFNFGKILPSTFTLCTLSAYTGIAQGKVIHGTNLIHGHSHKHVGVVTYGGKIVRAEKDLVGARNWIALCASNQHNYVWRDGLELPANISGDGGDISLSVNDVGAAEKSDWAVGEVMVWDRVLTRFEFNEVSNYLRAKAKTCLPEQAAQCDSAPCVSLFVGPNRHNVFFRNEDGTATVRSSGGSETSCICEGHCWGLVGIWKCEGGPYGGRYTISPSYADDWTPATNRDSILLCIVARPVWSKKEEVDSPVEVGKAKELIKDSSFTLSATIYRGRTEHEPMTIFGSEAEDSEASDDMRAAVHADGKIVFSLNGESCQTTSTEVSVVRMKQHVAVIFDLEKKESRIFLNGLEAKTCRFNARASFPEEAVIKVGSYKAAQRWPGRLKELSIYAESLSNAMIARLAGDLVVPKATVWHSYLDGWNKKSFIDAVSYCARRKMKMARMSDICRSTEEGVMSVFPKIAPGEQWAPYVGQLENSWVHIGDGRNTRRPVTPCKTYREEYGNEPSWGMDGKPHRWKSYLACIAPKGFIPYFLDGGQGKCTGDEEMLFQDPVRSASACKMQCLKSKGCNFATYEEAADGKISCLLVSSCVQWEADRSGNARTWMVKPIR